MDLKFSRLSDDYAFKDFDCNDADLNDFLLNDAKLYQEQLLAVTYILESDDEIVGFFCVSNDRICQEDTTKWRKVKDLVPHRKRRPSYPAVKIGRLAINRKYQKDGYGTKILNYIKFFFLENNKTGCRFLLVDAYLQSVGFYTKNKFIELPNDKPNTDAKLMYFDLNYLRLAMQ